MTGRRRWCRAGFACLLVVVLAAAASRPAPAATADEVRALVERAAAHIQDVGPEQAFADLTRPDGGFVAGELYVYCYDVSGTALAHGGNPKLVGKMLMDVRDREGTRPNAEILRIGLTQGQGWLAFFWPNPQTMHIQRKIAYVLRIDGRTVCGSGYYLPDPP